LGSPHSPYGREWQELLGDEDFVRMIENPIQALPQAVDYIARVFDDKSTTLLSVADGADLLVAGMTEQGLAANVAEYYGIPLAALHFFPTLVPCVGLDQLVWPGAMHA
jgi:vancomycin aglycone glucosyltransferase